VKVLRTAVIGLALLTASGCVSTLKPALPAPMTFVTLSATVNRGKIAIPESSRAVTMPLNTILRVEAIEYRGLSWHFGAPRNPKLLSYLETEGSEPCPAGNVGCASTMAEQYRANATGTTQIVFTLVPTGGGAQQPTAETVTLTVKVS
jgi:hypothetical protein